ncbi:MAG TPA: DAK2 domain-containing protein, partial [Acidimicrobiales bacterium]|nr:DAK2 domain-containing protein [Acidimicrobiales bacterium]
MATLERLAADQLRAVVTTFRDLLRTHQEAVNRLNVYPVPDGDTGTNMALTMESVVAGLADVEGVDMAAVCKAISHGSLMGARGNSGVILSQILRGLASTFAAAEDGADGALVAAGLKAASDGAYGAVMKPVEGTILTVVREASEAAAGGGSLVEVLDAARAGGQSALDRTPEMLPVLKEAGVVDAGGTGFLLLLDAALHVCDGRSLPEPPAVLADVPQIEHGSIDEAHDALSELRYEVMYFLEAPDETVPAFKEVWSTIGDSIVVVGGDGIWNCHIHTDDIGASIEAALDVGRPRNIRVTDLMEQVEEERWVRDAPVEEDPPAPEVTTAVVAVSTGDGIKRIFRSLGVHDFVVGGQTMNPSTQQLLDAVEGANAQQVVILPNNKNIIPVAEQVDALSAKSVRVVKTRGIAEGFAALLEYDPDADVESNVSSMTTAAGHVIAGEVTQAVRASTCDVGPIAEGDWLGISRDGILAVEDSLADATVRLLDALVSDDH